MQFCIGLRKNVTLTHHNKKIRLHGLFECPTLRTLSKPRKLYGTNLCLAGQKLPDGDYFIVGSPTQDKAPGPDLSAPMAGGPPASAGIRIETLFAAFKSRGFNLESCRVSLAKGSKRSFSSCLLLPRMGLNNGAVAR